MSRRIVLYCLCIVATVVLAFLCLHNLFRDISSGLSSSVTVNVLLAWVLLVMTIAGLAFVIGLLLRAVVPAYLEYRNKSTSSRKDRENMGDEKSSAIIANKVQESIDNTIRNIANEKSNAYSENHFNPVRHTSTLTPKSTVVNLNKEESERNLPV